MTTATLGDRMGTTDTQNIVLLAALGLGAYVLYKVFGAVSTVGQGLAAAGQEAADITAQTGELFDVMADPSAATWASWYDPTQRSVFVYVLTFPDGNHHVVWGSAVHADGTFGYNNSTYRIGTDKTGGLRAYQYNPAMGDSPPGGAS